jgi:hypothetical protein
MGTYINSRNHRIQTRLSMIRLPTRWWSHCSYIFPSIVRIYETLLFTFSETKISHLSSSRLNLFQVTTEETRFLILLTHVITRDERWRTSYFYPTSVGSDWSNSLHFYPTIVDVDRLMRYKPSTLYKLNDAKEKLVKLFVKRKKIDNQILHERMIYYYDQNKSEV